ncbi:MAG: glycoside hydrolase family 3, partial [Acidobacteria bacterium]
MKKNRNSIAMFVSLAAALFLLTLFPLENVNSAAADLDEQIGQMIMVGFRGLNLATDNPIVNDIRDRQVG